MKTAYQSRVRFRWLFVLLSLSCVLAPTAGLNAEGLASSSSRFYYQAQDGLINSARIYPRRLVRKMRPPAVEDSRIDPRLRRAATIAEERSNARTQARCWHYVKEALVAAGAVSSYPKTNYACDAGAELVRNFGFHKLPVRDPYDAPVGSVIVYWKGANGAGHVELRTKTGFASDYRSKTRCYYPLLAVYGKFSS